MNSKLSPSTISTIEGLLSGKPFSLCDAQNLINSVLARRDLKSGKLHGHFFYEIRPIFSVALYLSAQQIAYLGLSKGYDGEIHLNDEQSIRIECTRAVEGHSEAIRMEHLEYFGRAPAWGAIKYINKRKNRIICEEPPSTRMVSGNQINQVAANHLISAFRRKAQNKKLQANILIISFDDWDRAWLEDKDEFLGAFSVFQQNIADENRFSRIFIVGDSQKFLWDSNHPNFISYLSD